MRGEDRKQRGILRGYLFEIAVLELLRKNGFTAFQPDRSSPDYDVLFKEERSGFVELRGRGCWHQIDCPCDYNRIMPFSYPIRILGEVKYHRKPISKQYIREYIGVLKDIQENWVVSANTASSALRPRIMEIGVFFSASGFDESAEQLAYAHGIKTISYANNQFIKDIKSAIDDLKENHLSINCLETWSEFRQSLIDYLRGMDYLNSVYSFLHGTTPSLSRYINNPLDSLRTGLDSIKTTFFATTASGVVLQLFGKQSIPSQIFKNTDYARCKVYFEEKRNKRFYWIEFSEDDSYSPARFYFTPPESLDRAATLGGHLVLSEKQRIFNQLSVNIALDGISRNIIIQLDNDWFEARQKER